jgi:lipoprotein-anchoring transpeptidase ErfK/SrfK
MKEAAMKPTKGESRTVALAAMFFVAALSAQADEKQKRAEALDVTEKSAAARRIVISIQDCKLALLEGSRVVRIWETAVGSASTPSPRGSYTVVTRLSRPTYYRPGKVVPPGPSNPLGTRWLGLSLKGFGIHGTNAPGSIGHKASHGCIRMRNRDVEELFALVEVGVVVELFDERNEYVDHIFNSDVQPNPVLSAAVAAPSVPNAATAR